MEEYNDLIDKLYGILNTINSAENQIEKRKIFEDNITLFIDFKNSLSTILRLYHFKENGNTVQNEVSDKLKNVVMSLFSNKSFPIFPIGLISFTNINLVPPLFFFCLKLIFNFCFILPYFVKKRK